MNANYLLLISVGVFVIGAIGTLLLKNSSKSARHFAGISGMLASLIGFVAAVIAAIMNPQEFEIPLSLPFGSFTLQIDLLSALLVGLITLVGFAASLYSISYLQKYENRNLGLLGFFTNLFLASMLFVVTVSNAFYFVLFWELMTVASYFLVIFDLKNKDAIKAGFVYMLIAHIGGMLIMVSFFILYLDTGSFAFSSFRQTGLSGGLRNLVFLMAFIGFGTKAGVVPLHFWMPASYAAAPSHATALISSVMKKTAIYGFLRITVDFLGGSVLWWGLLLLFFGALSAVIGILFALVERDIKRMLAYSSVENAGIILLGIGTGIIGLAEKETGIAIIGFLAALYHLVNHSFFKSLLFLSAGAVEHQVNTRDLNLMGALAKRMPITALTFLLGTLAIAAAPPLNGFVSEWFTYQSLFLASSSPEFSVRVFAPLAAVFLALTGALVAMCFVKAYGSAFAGPARTKISSQASEAPRGMRASLIYLAACCLLLGLGAPLVASFLARVAASLSSLQSLPVASGVWVFPTTTHQAILSTPLVAMLLMGLVFLPVILVAIYGGYKPGKRSVDEPWATGYGYSSRMSVTASSFDQPLTGTFKRIFSFRALIQTPYNVIASRAEDAITTFKNFEPIIEKTVKIPIIWLVDFSSKKIQTLQMGDIRVYCFYIVFTLAVLLIVIFR